jgi:hypothetical protein
MESFNKFSKEVNYKEAPTLFLEFHGGESEVQGQAKATGLRLLWLLLLLRLLNVVVLICPCFR